MKTPEQELQEDIEILVQESLKKLGVISRWVNLDPYVTPFAEAIVKMSRKYVEAKLKS
jgi:DNA polymerase sigma